MKRVKVDGVVLKNIDMWRDGDCSRCYFHKRGARAPYTDCTRPYSLLSITRCSKTEFTGIMIEDEDGEEYEEEVTTYSIWVKAFNMDKKTKII